MTTVPHLPDEPLTDATQHPPAAGRRSRRKEARPGELLDAALDGGVTPVEVKEILYQAVPYVGLARTFDFIGIANDVENPINPGCHLEHFFDVCNVQYFSFVRFEMDICKIVLLHMRPTNAHNFFGTRKPIFKNNPSQRVRGDLA